MRIRLLYALLTLTLLGMFLVNTGCGTARANCHLGGQTCETLLGIDYGNDVAALQDDMRLVKREIETLSTQVNYMIKDIEADALTLLTLQSVLTSLQSTVNSNEASTLTAIDNINNQILQISSRIDYQDTRIADMLTDIVALEQQDSVVEYVYPCGSRPSLFDEVLVRTKSGKLLAYFESGGNRYLSLLKPGNYSTTDSNPRCQFTLNSSLQITNAHR